jgi:hypothetical protein
MSFDLPRRWLWPLGFAILFLSLPPLLFALYPSSFWAKMDYEPHGLADALNLAYRLADRQMYPARGLMDHPGVPFYFMSWLALALTGYPTATSDPGFFATVIANVERFHLNAIWLAALVGATGIYVLARAAQKLVPTAVVALGLIVWLVSTPAVLLMFLSPSIDSFGILINALFLVVLVRIADDRHPLMGLAVLSAATGAFAYLNKLSYIYVALALAAAGILNLIFRRPGWLRAGWLCILFGATFVLVVLAAGFGIIGRQGFHDLLGFHKSVFRGSGLYGAEQGSMVSGEALWRAVAAIPADRTYAMVLALCGGAILIAGGLATSLRGVRHFPAAIIGTGAGVACSLSAIIVLKHYALHYTAGVAATLPAGVVAGYLLLKDWGFRPGAPAAVLAVAVSLLMATQTIPALLAVLASRSNTTELAKADYEEIRTHLAGDARVVEFVYRAPFADYGEGFVVTFGSVPRLTEAYRRSRPNVISSMTADLADREIGAFVLDKAYFPTAETIRAAPNIALLASKPVTLQDTDRLIELRTCFLVIRR